MVLEKKTLYTSGHIYDLHDVSRLCDQHDNKHCLVFFFPPLDIIFLSAMSPIPDPFCTSLRVERLQRMGLQEKKQVQNGCLSRALVAAGRSTLLSVYILHCGPTYSLAIPSSPVNVNASINSLFVVYPSVK